jgi:RNA polymerase sigma factor (sigma-70 family)
MLGNRADAEDATQDAFLRAHRQAGTFHGECAPSTWLFAIARNACLDRLRARSPRRFAALDEIVARGLADAAPHPPTPRHASADAVVERRHHVAAVREGCLLGTLACLTDDQRAAFVLRTLCDVGTAETAAILGRSENAVRVLTHRARTRLKDFLCRNCSLWDAVNPCRCTNLVEFSLAQGWIGPDDERLADGDAWAEGAASAIESVARLTALYATLEAPHLRSDVAAQIRADLAGMVTAS